MSSFNNVKAAVDDSEVIEAGTVSVVCGYYLNIRDIFNTR
jgi:hypothetical protein